MLCCANIYDSHTDRREILNAKTGESARVVFRNHLGSAALGGLLLSGKSLSVTLFPYMLDTRGLVRLSAPLPSVALQWWNCCASACLGFAV